MALRKIVKEGDDVLRKHCREVTKFDERLATIIDDMAETMYSAEGVGLAAPQVGILRRIVVMDCGDGLLELVNPQIVKTSGEQIKPEGCLSVPDRSGYVKRPAEVTVKAQDRNGNWCMYKGTEMKAVCFCHEIDHLDGILYIDKLEKNYNGQKD